MKKLLVMASALALSAGVASAQSAFSSANSGWSVNSTFNTFGSGSHSFSGGVAVGTGSLAGANDNVLFDANPFGAQTTSGAFSASGGFGGGSASTFSGLSNTSMTFMGVAESGAQASD